MTANPFKKMVDAAGIEPATPAMSKQGSGAATVGSALNSLADLAQCSHRVHGELGSEVHDEPRGSVLRGGTIYHGTPLTPRAALQAMAGRAFCVSFYRPDDMPMVDQIASGVMLDNGAFSFWMAARRKGEEACEAERNWKPYHAWCEQWLAPNRWAVVPDAIAMPSQINDGLLNEWPLGKAQAAPVWHMDEPIARLMRLIEQGWNRVCLGWVHADKRQNAVGSPAYFARMDEVARELGNDWPPLHMLRGTAVARLYPFCVGRQHQPSAKRVAI